MCVSLARRVNSTAVNRRTFLAFTAVAFATAGLSACSRPAPEPNQTLVSLAEQARTDAAALAPVRSDLAAIRERHATMLSTEVARDCGHFENGSVPDSCVSTTSPSPPSRFLVSSTKSSTSSGRSTDAGRPGTTRRIAPGVADHSLPQARDDGKPTHPSL